MSGYPGTAKPHHLGTRHPLASVARQHCKTRHASQDVRLLGDVACGECWELAIRDDEQVAVEFGLPRELTVDPTYVDEIAVDLACLGYRVELTVPERVAAVERLAERGLKPWRIAHRLRLSHHQVAALLSDPERLVADSGRSALVAA